jgi:hypothetical protein
MLISPLTLLANAADEHSGIKFERTQTNGIDHPVGYYNTDKRYEKMPITFEAWVYVPKSTYSSRQGAILGNYQSFGKDDYVNFEIHSSGIPRLVFGDNAGNMYDYKFSRAPVPADKWTHVAIVYGTGTDGKQISCYINGQFKQKTAVDEWYGAPDEVRDNMLCLAGDYRALNEQAFRGTLGDVWVYSDVRTSAEILSGIIADEAAIGMVNSKTTAVRLIPAIGKKPGDILEFGGLFGSGPIMKLHNDRSSEKFISRGGRIPAPMQSLKN